MQDERPEYSSIPQAEKGLISGVCQVATTTTASATSVTTVTTTTFLTLCESDDKSDVSESTWDVALEDSDRDDLDTEEETEDIEAPERKNEAGQSKKSESEL
eukprot:2442640-Ditylum_brightwellii.AAC.1